jgi:hypothetical protein
MRFWEIEGRDGAARHLYDFAHQPQLRPDFAMSQPRDRAAMRTERGSRLLIGDAVDFQPVAQLHGDLFICVGRIVNMIDCAHAAH